MVTWNNVKQCLAAYYKAKGILGFIVWNINYKVKDTILTYYSALVRPYLEYIV